MYPYLLPEVFGGLFPLYDIMIIIGCFFMLLFVGKKLETRLGYKREESNKYLVVIVLCLFLALAFSYAFDTLFHSIEEGEFTHGSITFLGGLIGGIVSFIFIFHYFFKEYKKDFKEIINIIFTGVVLAHAFGRIGCFLAGCCFGIPTESFLGVVFPHGQSSVIYPGESVFPTQLFESFYLFALFFVMNKVEFFKHKEAEMYLICYGVFRFLIEFIRGDSRGAVFTLITTEYNVHPTPSQLLSFGLIAMGVILLTIAKKRDRNQLV